jgi:hypothetical protein
MRSPLVTDASYRLFRDSVVISCAPLRLRVTHPFLAAVDREVLEPPIRSRLRDDE